MKKIALVLAFLMLLSGCRNVGKTEIPKENFPVVIGGMKFLEAPEKVVVLSLGLRNLINEAGFGKFVSDEKEIGDEYYPDSEKIIESEAELVLSFMELEASVIKTLSESGVRVLVLKKPSTLSELKETYLSISRLFVGDIDGEAVGEEAFKKYEKELEPIKKAFSKSSFVYIKNRDLEPIKNSLLNSILGECFKNDNPERLNDKELKKLNPDYIFLGSGVDKTFISSLDISESLSAIENEKIISLSENILDNYKTDDLKELKKALGIE